MFAPLLIAATLNLAPVKIVDVSVTRHSGAMTVQVAGDGLLSIDSAKGRLEAHALRLTLPDTTVAEAEQLFGKTARARRKGDAVEIKIALSRHADCSGPVHFEASAKGLSASVHCADRGTHAAAEPAEDEPKAADVAMLPRILDMNAAPVREPALRTAALPVVAEKVEKQAVEPAMPTVPTPAPTPTFTAKPPVVVAPPIGMTALILAKQTEGKKEAAPAAKPAEAKKELIEALPPKAVTAATAATTKDASDSLAPATSSTSPTRALLVPMFVLALLGCGAFFFTKKRTTRTRFVTILETANLGPKRSLVVAQVGGETLLIGTSEAGITLLSSKVSAPKQEVKVEAKAETKVEPEGFFKSMGFGKHDAPDSTSFELLLEEAAEDELLRRKLNEGISGRVA